jgi:hypothetical protein
LEPAASKPEPRPRKWLVPDLALTAAAVTAFLCLFLFDGSRKLFRDSDTGWHIRTGEAILATGQLPRTDPYSWTRGGEPWFAWEWGADALMGAAHRSRGPSGVVALYVAAISAVTWLWFKLQWRCGGDFLLACAMAAPMLSTANLHWLARPHVLSWCLLLAWLIAMERGSPAARPRHFALAAAFGALWANIHASFFFAPAIAAAYALGSWTARRLWGDRPATPPLWHAGAAVSAALGSLANPYGPDLHRHLLAYLSNTELLKRVGEFQTFNFHSEGSAQILATVLIASAGATLSLAQRRLARAILLFGMLAVALRSARGLPMLALMLPLANGAITRALGESTLRLPLGYSANLRKLDASMAGWAWMPVLGALIVGACLLPAIGRRAGFPPDQFPVEAAPKIPPDARLLAPDKFGGYLIYRFAGQRKVFFDGRSDFYGTDFMKQYIDLVQVRPGWETILGRWKPTHALLPPDYSLRAALEREGWRTLHADPVAVLLAAP